MTITYLHVSQGEDGEDNRHFSAADHALHCRQRQPGAVRELEDTDHVVGSTGSADGSVLSSKLAPSNDHCGGISCGLLTPVPSTEQ